MSTAPPGPPPPPPPIAPPPAGTPGAIPWEERQRYGFVPALVETVKLFVTAPAEAWRRTPEKGSILDPLLFAILVSWLGAIVRAVYGMFFTVPWLRMMPPAMRERFGGAMAGHAFGFVAQVILAPIAITLILFIWSAILHVCLMMVGGLSASTSGFDGTFRVSCYSSVADLAQAIPLLGGLVAAIWKIVLVVMGIVALHRTTQGKAIAAVLIPLVVCCGCAALLSVLIFGAVFGAMRH
ncbi:MAG TPA: YIP1 family protein [Thermoanaerobaculia bacterium]|nr:YIP1 family protein [Thermoanaerobaculia bacterium]